MNLKMPHRCKREVVRDKGNGRETRKNRLGPSCLVGADWKEWISNLTAWQLSFLLLLQLLEWGWSFSLKMRKKTNFET